MEKKIQKEEAKDMKRMSKILKQEAKTEMKALEKYVTLRK